MGRHFVANGFESSGPTLFATKTRGLIDALFKDDPACQRDRSACRASGPQVLRAGRTIAYRQPECTLLSTSRLWAIRVGATAACSKGRIAILKRLCVWASRALLSRNMKFGSIYKGVASKGRCFAAGVRYCSTLTSEVRSGACETWHDCQRLQRHDKQTVQILLLSSLPVMSSARYHQQVSTPDHQCPICPTLFKLP